MLIPRTVPLEISSRNLLARELLIAMSILCACLFAGCGESSSQMQSGENSLLPQEIQVRGDIWELGKPLSPQEEQRLKRFFAANPLVIDNPLIQGTPQVYRKSPTAYRLYWITPIDESIRWVAIEFDGSNVVGPLEGDGEEFTKK